MLWVALVLGLALAWVLWPLAGALRENLARRRQTRRMLRDAARSGDPMATLELQVRLAELAAEIQVLERTPGLYALSHHMKAALGAYDQVLEEACALAGIQVAPTSSPMPEGERLRRELELSERGWSW